MGLLYCSDSYFSMLSLCPFQKIRSSRLRWFIHLLDAMLCSSYGFLALLSGTQFIEDIPFWYLNLTHTHTGDDSCSVTDI